MYLRLLRTAVLGAFAMIAVASPATTHAGLDDELKGVFDGMMNVTPADAYMTQRRGVITGGSLQMRNRMVNPNLVSFVPPRFKAGCNGIDLFMGSFSFINSEQLTQLMRNIAQAAVGYAFQLAIEGMCPTCAQVMSKLQKDIEFLNSLMRNSCEAAKKLVDGSGLGPSIRGWAEERKKEASSLDTSHGFLEDFLKADSTNDRSSTAVLIQNGAENELKGNVVKQALDQSSAVDWYAYGDDELKMVLMSLTGTLIIGKGQDADGNDDIDYKRVPAILKVRDFIEGGTVKVYACDDDRCTAPTPQSKTITGMRERVRKMVLGTGVCVACSGGIVRKMAERSGGSTFTPEEQKFIQASSPGAYSMLSKIAAEPQAMALVADRMVDALSVEMTHVIVDVMFDTVREAVTSTGRPMDTSMLMVLRDLRVDINEQRRVAADAQQSVALLLQVHDDVRQGLMARHPAVAAR